MIKNYFFTRVLLVFFFGVLNVTAQNEAEKTLLSQSYDAELTKRTLYFLTTNFKLIPNVEEVIAYQHELEFLKKVPCVDEWLIENAKNKIKFYSKP